MRTKDELGGVTLLGSQGTAYAYKYDPGVLEAFENKHLDEDRQMKDSLIVVSGGMDSVTMLYEFKDAIAFAVSFDYGSNHNANEIPLAAMHCKRLGIEHVTIPLGFIKAHMRSALLDGAAAIPEGHYAEGNMAATVVPFRNGIMLSVACGIAASRGLRRVMIANHSGDHAIYPDCRPAFIGAMSQAMERGTAERCTVFAPYTGLSKGMIALRGKRIGIDYSETWSCYKGGERHCGKCATCIERREALSYAGIDDRTEYGQG